MEFLDIVDENNNLTGETPIKALKREVLEEIGTKLRDDQIEFIKEFKNNTESNKSFNYNYFVRVNYRIEEYIIQKEELSFVRWYKIEEVIRLIEVGSKEIVFKKDEIRLFKKLLEVTKKDEKESFFLKIKKLLEVN